MPPVERAVERLVRVREPFLASLRAGASMADAGRTVGVAERTVQNWVSRGGREPDGEFSRFAADVRVAREGLRSGPMDSDELAEVVARAARGGSVQAMKLAWEMVKTSGQPAAVLSDSLTALDELAARRSRQTEAAG